MVAVGHLIGYGAGALNLGSIFGSLIGDTQFKQLIVIAVVALLATVAITSWATTERVLVSNGYVTKLSERDLILMSQQQGRC